MTLQDKLLHSTIRLDCELIDGGQSCGTGFIFAFHQKSIDENTKEESAKNIIPMIITNKHVIKDSTKGRFVFTLKKEDGSSDIGKYKFAELDNFESKWILHPDSDVDLAAMPIAHLLKCNKDIFFSYISDHFIYDNDQLNSLAGIEDIIMIGYPNGIWDHVNNLPVIRKGITATHPKYKWQGKDVFVIDCACFPGSSGSPVLICNSSSYSNSRGGIAFGSRVVLLGVLFSGPVQATEGEIVFKKTEDPFRPISITNMPINLGFVINAQKILDFRSFF